VLGLACPISKTNESFRSSSDGSIQKDSNRMAEDAVAQLTAMGFETGPVNQALRLSNGNLEQAVNLLLSGSIMAEAVVVAVAASPSSSGGGGTSSAVVFGPGGMVLGPMSQYSVEQGRSACTCIALTAASQFLQHPIVTPDLLQSMIVEGVRQYESLLSESGTTSASGDTIEHMSAEDVLLQDSSSPSSTSRFAVQLVTSIGVRQGMLTNDPHYELGLRNLLGSFRLQQHPSNEWMAVLMTKTPETVLVLFPPPQSSHSESSSFWLIDSHPRSSQLPGADMAYGKPHANLDELCATLHTIFPSMDLGPDVPEMMGMMYNSFDLYPLTRRKPQQPRR
jgi:hypothetical protein